MTQFIWMVCVKYFGVGTRCSVATFFQQGSLETFERIQEVPQVQIQEIFCTGTKGLRAGDRQASACASGADSREGC